MFATTSSSWQPSSRAAIVSSRLIEGRFAPCGNPMVVEDLTLEPANRFEARLR